MNEEKLLTPPTPQNAPDIPRRLFWEFRYESIDWQKHSRMVIERVLNWGMDTEVEALIRFYGFNRVKRTLRDRPMYLMAHQLDRACRIFGLKQEETVCYKRKVERGFGWI
jgi:hypothetical protein